MFALPSFWSQRYERVNELYFNDPDRISKNSVLCSIHFTADSFTNKTSFNARFKKILKLKDNPVTAILDPTVCRKTSYCFHYMVTLLLSLLRDRLICIKLCMWIWRKSQQHPSMRNVRCEHTQLLANHSSGRLHPRLFKQSVLMRGLKTGQKIAYSKLWCFLM